MALVLEPDDPRLTWQGAVSLQRTDDWVMPWRIPFEEAGLFPPLALQERAAGAAGIRVAFRSDTTAVAGRVVPQAEDALIDLYCDGVMQGSVSVAATDRFSFDGLPGGEKLIELWLPQYAQFRLRSLELDDGASVASYDDGRPRWTAYGSSITHCKAAESPSMTWPAIVAREHGLNLTCLGYGGNCHLEPMIAMMIRDLPADFISLKAGINIYSGASLGIRTFRAALIGFVKIVREGHPDTPLAVASPIVAPARESTENEVGLTLEIIRDEVEAAVDDLRAHGDRNVHYVDGLKLFGNELAHLLSDGVHPNAEGYKHLARNFSREVAGELFAGAPVASHA